MALIVSDFYELLSVGDDPLTISQLIPYVIDIYIGVALVCGLFRVIGKICELLVGWRHW